MQYSKDFLKRIKKAYGEESYAYQLALDGKYSIGTILRNKIKQGVNYAEIFNAKSLKQLQDAASDDINLYEFWYDEMLVVYGNDQSALNAYLEAHNMYIDLTTLETKSSL